MRFTPFVLLAPALLAAAQSSTNSGDSSSSTSAQSSSASDQSASSSSRSSSSSSSSSAAQSSSSGSSDNDSDSDLGSDGIYTKTFLGGQATLVTNQGGNIVGTVFGPNELASTLNNNDNLGTLVSSVPPTVYTTSGPVTLGSSAKSAGYHIKTVGGGPVTLITGDGGDIEGTVYGPKELASTLNDNDNLGTLVSSVPLTTFTTSDSIPQQTQGGSDNAAPAATGAPLYAGGLIGAGMMVVGLL